MSLTAKLISIALITLVILFVIAQFKLPHQVLAIGNLTNAQDLLSNDTNSQENVEHAISFDLPGDAIMVDSSDYIIINLSSFSEITLPTSMTGGYLGTPSYSLDGSEIKITGIAILPGNAINIYGVTATNPNMDMYYGVTITISEDVDGNIINYFSSFYAAEFDASVQVTASIAPPVASLRITGNSSPGTFITFTENGTVIGTDTAGAGTGLFSKYFTGLSGSTHNISIYGVDQQYRTTSPLTFQVYTPIYQETTVSDLLLAPTIQISGTAIVQGGNLVASGSALPSGDISLFTESPLSTYYTTCDSGGAWAYTITDSDTYNVGDYRIYSLVQNASTSAQSLFSNSLQFSVAASSSATPTPAACDISEGDLSCDGNVNLADFSILMYYWGTNEAAADINEDELVNLVDFSVMMYYWGT